MDQVASIAGGRLVVVDDEPVILEVLTSIFRNTPYEVVACPNGNSAIAAMNEGGVDVLLTDKNLPDVGGIELIKHARTVSPDVECLIITGYPSLDTALTAVQLEVFDYIIKPPKDIFEVRRKVQQAFEKQAVVRENRSLTDELKRRNGELQKTLNAVKELQNELIQSEKLAGIGTLAAGIAHEISSPLFGIMGLAEAISEEDDLDIVRGYARDIVEYTRGIRDIVRDLSGYTRTANREYVTTIDVPKVVDDAVRLVTRTLKVESSQVRVEVPAGLTVHARTGELQQVLVNLVKNALEAVNSAHADGRGQVTVRAGRGEKQVWIEVIDNGVGIPEDQQAAVFDPFFTTKEPGKGTGLGLNIVYRILAKYRGTITVQSQVGQGTTFHLRLPAEGDA